MYVIWFRHGYIYLLIIIEMFEMFGIYIRDFIIFKINLDVAKCSAVWVFTKDLINSSSKYSAFLFPKTVAIEYSEPIKSLHFF